MNRNVKRLIGLALALAVTMSIAALSRVPYVAAGDEYSLIRFSWRTPSVTVEECRRPSQEELERLPVHMRRTEVCERRLLPYRLRVELNGRVVYDERVRAAGMREDRPLYVFRELPVTPGEHRLEVVWQRVENGSPSGEDPDPDRTESPSPRPQTTVPERLTLSAELHLEPGEVSLITYDLDRQQLVARGRGLIESESH
jgi:hypothetical protein